MKTIKNLIKFDNTFYTVKFLILILLPNLLFSLNNDVSIARYNFFTFLFVNIFTLVLFKSTYKLNTNKLIKLLSFILLFILLHLAASTFINLNEVHYFPKKALFSIFGIFVFVIAAYLFSKEIFFLKKFEFFLSLTFWIFLISAFIGAIFKIDFLCCSKNLIFFSEPSKFYNIFCIFFLSLLLINIKKNTYLLFLYGCYLLLYLLEPTLLGIIYGIFILFLVSKNFLNSYFLICLILFTIAIYLSSEYIFYKLFTNNLSISVFKYNYSRLFENFFNSNYIGYGFQSLGYEINYNFYYYKNNLDYNRYDGSFLLVKLISEFGIIALFFLLIYLYYFMFIVKLLLQPSPNLSIYDTFFISIYILFSISLFLRSYGYFTTEFFLFLSSIFYLKKRNFFSKLIMS